VLATVEQILFVPHLTPPQRKFLACSVVDGGGLMARPVNDLLRVGTGIHLDAFCLSEGLSAHAGCVLGLLREVFARCPLQISRFSQ
jgi:hypothetical protein